MMGTTVATFILCALIVEITFVLIPGVPRAIAFTIPNIELGIGYWIHALGVSPLHALVLAIGFAVVELGMWNAVFAALLRGWPVWRQANPEDVASIGKLGLTLDWLSQRAQWRGQKQLQGHWSFHYRYVILFFCGVFPGAFLLIGLPFAFKYGFRYAYLAILLGNSAKMTLFILGWITSPWYIALMLFLVIVGLAKWFSKRIAERGDLF